MTEKKLPTAKKVDKTDRNHKDKPKEQAWEHGESTPTAENEVEETGKEDKDEDEIQDETGSGQD